MFILLWSFGNFKNKFLNYFNVNKYILPYKQIKGYYNLSNYKLAPYLAGLIEGDGCIIVHNKNTKTKKYRPKIIIIFNLVDKPLAEKLSY